MSSTVIVGTASLWYNAVAAFNSGVLVRAVTDLLVDAALLEAFRSPACQILVGKKQHLIITQALPHVPYDLPKRSFRSKKLNQRLPGKAVFGIDLPRVHRLRSCGGP